jgi:hypothetical protein
LNRTTVLERLRATVASGKPVIGAGRAPACQQSAPKPAAST